jgi:hypothetical protein
MSNLEDAQKKLAAIEALQRAAAQKGAVAPKALTEEERIKRREEARALMKLQHAAEDAALVAAKEKAAADKLARKQVWQGQLADKADVERQQRDRDEELRQAKLRQLHDDAAAALERAKVEQSQFTSEELQVRLSTPATLGDNERDSAPAPAAVEPAAAKPVASPPKAAPAQAHVSPQKPVTSSPTAAVAAAVANPSSAVHVAKPNRNANLKLLRQLEDAGDDEVDVSISAIRERERAEREKKLHDLEAVNAKLKQKEDAHSSNN